MLPSDEEKAYIVSYCKTQGGGMSKCTKCKEIGVQSNCSFYEKGTSGDNCSSLRMGEYCGNFYSCDFADGKEVHIENIPNMPSIKLRHMREFIDTPYGRKEIFKDREYYGRRKIMRKSSPYPESMQEIVEKVRKIYHDEDGVLRDANTGARIISMENEESMDFHMGYFTPDTEMSDVMAEFERLSVDALGVPQEHLQFIKEGYSKNPCKEITIAVDNSGAMVPEKFHELAAIVAEELRNQTLTFYMPPITSVSDEHIRECMEAYCGAYCPEHKLFLDMSDPNMYTIYNANGNFISLRTLLKDGITPFNGLVFKMINGDECFEEYGFEEFVNMLEPMLAQGR